MYDIGWRLIIKLCSTMSATFPLAIKTTMHVFHMQIQGKARQFGRWEGVGGMDAPSHAHKHDGF